MTIKKNIWPRNVATGKGPGPIYVFAKPHPVRTAKPTSDTWNHFWGAIWRGIVAVSKAGWWVISVLVAVCMAICLFLTINDIVCGRRSR